MNGKVTYRQQFTRCGKQRCRKCREGTGHGPYWYAYWSENGRTVSKYIGIHLPKELAQNQETNGEVEETGTLQNSGPVLRIYVLGQFRIERRSNSEWQTIDNRTWHRRRARALLGCLLSSPGRRLGREQIMDQLWPELELEVAANRLNGAVHELRQILEPDIDRPANSQLLRLEHDILELANSTSIWVDAEAFESLLKEANKSTEPKHIERLYEEATNLYRGGYLLEELYAEWAAPRRDVLQRSWVGLQLHLAQLRAEQGALVSAIEILDRLRTIEPSNETALQRQMIFLTQLDRRGEALQLYRQHELLLEREYDSQPLVETSNLYETLRSGRIPEFSIPARPIITIQQDTQESPASKAASAPSTRLTFRRPIFQPGRHYQRPLIGREQEQAIIRQALFTAEAEDNPATHTAEDRKREKQKYPHFLLLRGEPGIGKTRLAEELSLEAYSRGWAIAWSRSYEQERTIPYRPWTELLRMLLNKITREELLQITQPEGENPSITHVRLERLSMLLPDLANHPSPGLMQTIPSLPHEQERLLLWEATLGLLEALSKFYPLLLVFDDLHWADDSSIEILTYLTHHLQNQRIFLIATSRDGELAPFHRLHTLIADLRREEAIITLPIQPLTHVQIGNLLSHLPQETIHSIQEQAAGNPFFAEELARYANVLHNNEHTKPHASSPNTATQELLAPDQRGLTGQRTHSSRQSTQTLPEAISAVLERRLSRLSNDCQALLGKAAVLGGSFELNRLLPMTNENEDIILDQLEEALHAGLLTEEGAGAHITYYFWHPLIISHLYERLSAARRAQLHRKAAEAFKNTTQQEQTAIAIVHHLSRGGGDPAQIAYYAELAGNQAYTLSGYSEARRYYLQAIQALINHERRTPENSELQAYTHTIHPKAISQLPGEESRHLCRLMEFVAECNIILGDYEDARFLYQCILNVFTSERYQTEEQLDQEQYTYGIQVQALLWRQIGTSWAFIGDYRQAYDSYKQGKDILAQTNITSGSAWACLHMEYGNLLRMDGRYDEARRYLQEALNVLEQIVQPSFKKGHATGARHPKEPATRIERSLIGDPLEIGYAHEKLGIVAASVGQLNDAFHHMRIALQLYEQNELLIHTARVYGNLGAAYAVKGDYKVARDYTLRSQQLTKRIGNTPNQSFIMGNLADITYRIGNLEEAERWYKSSLALTQKIKNRARLSWYYAEITLVQKDLGKLQEARESIWHAIKTGREIRNDRCVHYALLGLGALRIAEAQEKLFTNQISPSFYRQLLHRARATLQHLLSLEGLLEAEPTIEAKHLLATVSARLNETEQARQIAHMALKEAQENDSIRSAGRIYRLIGFIEQQRGELEQADAAFTQALQIFREHDLHLDYARTLHNYSILLLQCDASSGEQQANLEPNQQAMHRKGLDLLHEAQRIFITCHATLDEREASHHLKKYELQATKR